MVVFPFVADVAANQLRLVGGPTNSEGRVEINYNGEWGSVCQDGFDTYAAQTACQQLGMT